MTAVRSPVYLDHAATTPVDPRVANVVLTAMTEEFGNPHSRTHEYGVRSAKAVEVARQQLADVVDATPSEVVFTSGATESNNLAIQGLAGALRDRGLTHIVSTGIEHKAVLEPIERLRAGGFEVTLVPPERTGVVDAEAVLAAVRPETGLISVMHVNNETGAVQPIDRIADGLDTDNVYLHTDAAQVFGKALPALRNPRIDLISASGHKLYAPKGVGILVVRRRRYQRPPLDPILLGGGQERGLRGGTVAAPLAIGFGLAAQLALDEIDSRIAACRSIRQEVAALVESVGGVLNTPCEKSIPNVISFRIPGLNADAAMVLLKDHVAVATGSACTSVNVEPSYVLRAMGLTPREAKESMRWSWGPETEIPLEDVQGVLAAAVASA